MKGGTDAERREHHLQLIRDLVEEGFPDADVWVAPANSDMVICVRVPEARQLFRLRVAFEALEDAREDEEIQRALQEQRAIDRMRQFPDEVVVVTYREGAIFVRGPAEGSD